MTKSQLLENTTSEEISEWRAYFRVLEEEREEAKETGTKKSEADARARKQGR